ncbi:glycosyltransferase N-terminal domain-containing protein [Opitutus sp. ER46]|uniref:3-deoxy-D-manno-octulosonic acid transferase n=1 Tax=Opitutus sp. ER46 TaxID=2161864 RepID=UPI000D304DD3|nr:glycosyltransferase N-terminal domain-containing protein [Opitutus sp. ER46]PTY01089.1 3-deoxy-D-manno-octulosonic acid transferase [Opitutus sp. ER46]
MLWLYRVLFVPALLLMAPRYLWRMRKRGGYGARFGDRFGALPPLPPRTAGVRRIWLQAVSVGEVLAIGPLLEKLHAHGLEVYLTTTTSTGFRLANERYRALTVGIGYFPIDWWPFSRRAWQRIAPDLAIIAEGERWPEHLRQAAKRGVPVLCINARMSDRSFRRLRRFPGAAKLMFDGVTRLLPCSTHDEGRFRELGVPAAKLFTTGNIKLDLVIPPLTPEQRGQLRQELGLADAGFVLLGSSTWPREEEALVEALQALRAEGVTCSLLLVPRHAERREEIERLLGRTGLRAHFRSRGASAGPVDVAVGDTTGELRKLTQLADLVFVGKSLAPHTEGQTPVEAAALGKPILLGPGMANFRVISQELLAGGAARQVADPAALTRECLALARDVAERASLAQAATAWHRANAGAVDRTWQIIRETLGA